MNKVEGNAVSLHVGEKAMSEQDERKEEKKERKFSQEQYEMLLRCSVKMDVTEWNEWREKNMDVEILLELADLKSRRLSKINLQGANLWAANLQGSFLEYANLKNAFLIRANLRTADLWGANFQGANLKLSNLQGSEFIETDIRNTSFFSSVLDDSTLIGNCIVNKRTDFRGVGLGNVRIDPATRALLEYNVRRMNWKDWYKKHTFLRWPVRCFWELSDYGLSTSRIIWSFLGSALFFAMVYTMFPEIMKGISDGSFIHNLYISVTAMTSLGLSIGIVGKGCAARYCLLMAQYVFGYAILGALITRLNILFTAGGPSGDFAKPEKHSERE